MTDITADKVLEAHRQLEAQIEAAVRVAFDNGTDFIREITGTVDPNETPGHTTFAVRAGAWPIDDETPAGHIRYTRPANWKAIRAHVGVNRYRK